MPLQKRSRLHKVLIEFADDGKYVFGEALFQEGAWDTDANNWFGDAVEREYPLTNMTVEGKKAFNDVVGVTASKALEAAEAWKKELANTQGVNVDLKGKLEVAERDLKDALGARDNFARLHKEAKADLMFAKADIASKHEGWTEEIRIAAKVPRLIRALFGANTRA